jgi:hypothetical protein
MDGVGAADADASRLPAGFLEQITKDEPTLRLTLPNGRLVVGKIERLQRVAGAVASVQGTIHHPEPGEFAFDRQSSGTAPGQLTGHLRFASQTTQWKIQAGPGEGVFRLLELPAEDAFRPPVMVVPTAKTSLPPGGRSREDAESALRKDLKIEPVSPGKLRIGIVQLDQTARAIRFPAIVNMTAGLVEYAVVTSTGKCHEAVFSTKAMPRDIHLAMLLLGVKPAACVENPNKGLSIPAEASVRVTAEWETNGPLASRLLNSLVAIADQSPTEVTTATLPDQPWLYNGSRFNGAGFAATMEGSIISLINDDTALINSTGSDRTNDDIHVPNAKLLPAVGMPVTIVISLPPNGSSPGAPPARP